MAVGLLLLLPLALVLPPAHNFVSAPAQLVTQHGPVRLTEAMPSTSAGLFPTTSMLSSGFAVKEVLSKRTCPD